MNTYLVSMSLYLEELIKEVVWLKEQIEGRGGQLMCHGDVINPADAVNLSVALFEESVILSSTGKVHLRLPRNYREHIKEQSNFAHVMSMSLSNTHWDMITTISHTHLLLSQYRNQLLHVFSAEGILAMILNKRNSIDLSEFIAQCILFTCSFLELCFMDFSVLCSSLNRDLLLPQQPVSELFQSLLWSMRDRGLLVMSAGAVVCPANNSSHALNFLANLMVPFTIGAWVRATL